MSIPLTINGAVFEYPVDFDENWGVDATGWAQAVTNGVLQMAGGSFPLTADVNFGPNFGLLSKYFETRSSLPATTGTVRLSSADAGIAWRNFANSGNNILTTDASNNLQYNGATISGGVNTGTQYQLGYYATTGSNISGLTLITANRALASDANGLPVASSTTATELGYVNGVTSAIQTQINTKAPSANPTFTGVIESADGSVSAPAYTFASDADNGMYLIGANNPALTAGGTKVIDLQSTGVAVKGNNLGGSAATGFIGEILQASRQRGSELSLSSSVSANVCSLSITAGVWLIVTEVGFEYDSTTNNTTNTYSLSKTSATLTNANTTMLTPTSDGEQRGEFDYSPIVHGNTVKAYAPIIASALVTGTTTYYLVALSTFTVSTVSVFGSITATRIG